jgi:hypothetical protein
MRRLLAAAVLAIAFCSPASNIHAASTGPEPAQDAGDPESQVRAWLARVAAWGSQLQTIYHAEVQLHRAVNLGVNRVLDRADHSDVEGERMWLEDWTKARRAEVADVDARLAAMPKDPPPVPSAISEVPQIKAFSANMLDYAHTAFKTFQADNLLAEDLIALAAKAGSGDADAAKALRARRYDLTSAALRGENLMLQNAVTLSSANPGEQDLLTSNIDSNLSLVALYDLRRAYALDRNVDRAPFVAEMRLRASAAIAAAQKAPEDVKTSLARLHAMPGLAGTGLMTEADKAMSTFSDSAKVEVDLSNLLLDAANLLDKGEAPDSPTVDGALSGLSTQVAERVRLIQARREVLANSAR